MKEAREALAAWGHGGRPIPADDGLINCTWLVGAPGADGAFDAVLQWVNPVFAPQVEQDIEAVTAWLQSRGMVTPRLRRLPDGALALPDTRGHWRLMDFVPGRTLHRLSSPAQAAAAGALLGRFHAAMADWPGSFAKPPRNIHDTPARMAELRAALHGADGHPQQGPARDLGQRILAAWDRWDGDLDLPMRPCHGDPKISNLRFAEEGDHALCLVDLDTLGLQRLADELGDAWRSWCNPAGEDTLASVRFDLDLFAASASAWLAHAPPLSDAERASLAPGIERICLELAARFCADAVAEQTYFREDRKRFPVQGDHDLHRARIQLRLADAARAARPDCDAILDPP